MLAELSAWIATTSVSQAVGNALWVVPFFQSLHLLAIAAVMAPVWLICFRLLGLAGRNRTIAETTRGLAPWIWRGLVVLLLSGVVLIVGEPARQLTSSVFLAKMAMLAVALAATVGFERLVTRGGPAWDGDGAAPGGVRFLAVAALGLWVAIAVAGRWIAYSGHA